MTPVWFFVCIAGATPNAPLATAEDLVANVRYADAEKPLTAARAVPDNSRETLLRILELQGVVAATLNNPQKARAYFQQLLSLDPERKLPEGQPPRVRTQNTPRMARSISSARLSGILGISPDAKPITR